MDRSSHFFVKMALGRRVLYFVFALLALRAEGLVCESSKETYYTPIKGDVIVAATINDCSSFRFIFMVHRRSFLGSLLCRHQKMRRVAPPLHNQRHSRTFFQKQIQIFLKNNIPLTSE
jgi:hypothetical protein